MSEELILIYNKALDILSRREHSTKELVIKLEKKFTSNSDILLTVSKLKKNNLLNDIRFTESYVAARKRKGFGPKKIEFELISKGIKDSDISYVLSGETGWCELAKKAFNKKFKNGPSNEINQKLKQKNFLKNRGFTFQEIESVFSDDML
ncbi:recombination regulator RecX [Gammaproteobacteria bacterium]|nr:recombination regulator RecX [Gammaproteobacteria bacterium]